MKTKITQYIAIAILLGSSCLYARIGESLVQCEERYGKSQFQKPKGDYEYRSYNLNGKCIRIVFYKSVSVHEIVIIGPRPVFAQEQVDKFAFDSREFIRGLLKTVYGYSDEELEKISSLRVVNQRKSESGVAKKGNLRASWMLKANHKEDQLTFIAVIAKWESEADYEKYLECLGEGEEAEERAEREKSESQKAKGF